MNDLLKLIPFLSNYPLWVKGIFVIWVFLSAVLIVCLVLTHGDKPKEQTITKEHETVPKKEISTAVSSQEEKVLAKKAPEKLPQNYSPISAENVISTLNNDDLTELQKKNFMKEHDGRIVRWEGIMLDIKPGTSDRWPTVMAFRLPSDDSTFPEVLTASFSGESVNDLSALKKGQKFAVQGNLKFVEIGSPSVSIENAQLVSY